MTAQAAATVLLVLCLTGTTGCKRKEAPSPAAASGIAHPPDDARVIHALTVKRLDGADVPLASFAGKVLLVVNTASECGFTPQYEKLQALHSLYAARGFSVLGFPSNDFGGQEPGSGEQIAKFCKVNYGVTFPMFQKVQTTGSDRAPLYALLAAEKGEPLWNFHKYLVDKKGRPVEAWASRTLAGSRSSWARS